MSEAELGICYLLSFEGKGRGHETRNVSVLYLEARKSKKDHSPASTLVLSQ